MRHEQEPLNSLPVEVDVSADLRETIQDTAEKLKSLGDQLRIKLHLAGMEAKDFKSELFDSVDNLSRRLGDYAGTLEKTKESAEVQLHLGLMEARKTWDSAKEGAQQFLNLWKEDQGKAKSFLEDMRVQAQLAKAEGQDALQKTKQDINENVRDITRQGAAALQRMNKSVSDFLHSLS